VPPKIVRAQDYSCATEGMMLSDFRPGIKAGLGLVNRR
jgi:hypothetical protein